jgi:hypothetical protein
MVTQDFAKLGLMVYLHQEVRLVDGCYQELYLAF